MQHIDGRTTAPCWIVPAAKHEGDPDRLPGVRPSGGGAKRLVFGTWLRVPWVFLQGDVFRMPGEARQAVAMTDIRRMFSASQPPQTEIASRPGTILPAPSSGPAHGIDGTRGPPHPFGASDKQEEGANAKIAILGGAPVSRLRPMDDLRPAKGIQGLMLRLRRARPSGRVPGPERQPPHVRRRSGR